MADHAPDPWSGVRKWTDGNGRYVVYEASDVDRARDAERQQHQQTIQQQAAQIETLTQALREALSFMPDVTAYQRERRRIVAAALAGASRPTEGEQGAKHVGLSSMLNAPTLLRQRVNQALAALASPPPASGDVERLKDMFMRGWNLGFTAIAREPEEIERERRCDWEYVLSTLTHPTPGEQA